MKAYVYRPRGHGSHSFAVLAESEKAARALVDAHVKAKYTIDEFVSPRFEYQASGWGTDYYELETYEVGEVMEGHT